MKPRAARRRFFSLLPAYASELSLLSLSQGVQLMSRFYRSDRFTGCDPSQGQDILFCEWGLREQERGDWFAFEFVRQLIDGSKRGRSVRQLRLSFWYTAKLQRQMPAPGRLICSSPLMVPEFQISVNTSTVAPMLIEFDPLLVDLSFQPVPASQLR